MKRYAIHTLVLMVFFAAPAHAAWHFAWQQEPGTDRLACTLTSDPELVWTGPGDAATEVRINVQGEGKITITSTTAPFPRRAVERIGINVDEQPAISGPDISGDKKELTFSEDASIALHRLFEQGSVILATVMFTENEPVTKRFSLEGYRLAAAQYKGCRGLLINPGWLGLFMTAATARDGRIKTGNDGKTDYRGPGIEVLAVDPRKEAHKSGLLPGDRIVAADAREVEVKTLITMMKGLEAGASVTLDVVREGAHLRMTVTRPPVLPDRDRGDGD